MGKHGNISFFVPHLGCPCRCSFCDQQAITGNERPPSPEEVLETAKRQALRLGDAVSNTQLAFFGGSFTAIDRGSLLGLLEAGCEAVRRFGFSGLRCSTRPDAIDPERIALLQKYGMKAVELGAQSMCDEVLAANFRGHTAVQTQKAAALIRSSGMELGVQMMTGLYRDTPERAVETGKQLLSLQPATVRIYPAVVLPGTQLAAWAESGVYRPQSLEEAVALCAELLSLFESAGVRVIRMGLHADRTMQERLLCGPYHPAFRELVQSRLHLQRLLAAFQRRPRGVYRVEVAAESLSAMTGQKKCNQKTLAGLGYQAVFQPSPGLSRDEFTIREG